MTANNKRMTSDTFFDRLIKESFRSLPIGKNDGDFEFGDLSVSDLEADFSQTAAELSPARPSEAQQHATAMENDSPMDHFTTADHHNQNHHKQAPSSPIHAPAKNRDEIAQPIKQSEPIETEARPVQGRDEQINSLNNAERVSLTDHLPVDSQANKTSQRESIEINHSLNKFDSASFEANEYLNKYTSQVDAQKEEKLQAKTIESVTERRTDQPLSKQVETISTKTIQEPIQRQQEIRLPKSKIELEQSNQPQPSTQEATDFTIEQSISQEQPRAHKYSFGPNSGANKSATAQAKLHIGTVNIRVTDHSPNNQNAQGSQSSQHKRGTSTQNGKNRSSKSLPESRSFLRTL